MDDLYYEQAMNESEAVCTQIRLLSENVGREAYAMICTCLAGQIMAGNFKHQDVAYASSEYLDDAAFALRDKKL